MKSVTQDVSSFHFRKRERDRQTERRIKETESKKERESETVRDRKEKERKDERKADRQKGKTAEKERERERQTDRQTETQTCRQTKLARMLAALNSTSQTGTGENSSDHNTIKQLRNCLRLTGDCFSRCLGLSGSRGGRLYEVCAALDLYGVRSKLLGEYTDRAKRSLEEA